MNRIIYMKDDGGVAVIIPSSEVLQLHTIEEIAQKDVPYGKPYKIATDADILEDRALRDAWTVDGSALTDGVGGESNKFNEGAV